MQVLENGAKVYSVSNEVYTAVESELIKLDTITENDLNSFASKYNVDAIDIELLLNSVFNKNVVR